VDNKFQVLSALRYKIVVQGTTNLLTRCLAALDKKIETVPDPTQVCTGASAHPCMQTCTLPAIIAALIANTTAAAVTAAAAAVALVQKH